MNEQKPQELETPEIGLVLGDAGASQNVIDRFSTTDNPLLAGQMGSREYLKMTADPYVGAILNAYKSMILACEWKIVCPNEADDATKKAHAMIEQYFFKDGYSLLPKILPQILTLIEFGFSLFEKVYMLYDYEKTTYIMPKIEQRWQTSIWQFEVTDGYVRQQKRVLGEAKIPFSKCVTFTLNQYGDDMRGRSVLYHAHDAWGDKKQYLQRRGIGLSRASTGVPWVKVPEGITSKDEEYITVQKLIRSMLDSQGAYLMTPATWEFQLLTNTFNPAAFTQAINECNAAMVTSTLLQFLLLGQNGNGGAYSLGQDQSDFFLNSLQYIVTFMESVFAEQVIKEIVALNFTNVDYTQIELKGLNLKSEMSGEFAKAITELTAAKLIIPTVDDEIQFRDMLKMGGLTDEQKAQHAAIMEEQALTTVQRPEPGVKVVGDPNLPAPVPAQPSDKPIPKPGAMKVYKFSEKDVTVTGQERKQMIDDELKVMQAFMTEQLNFINNKLKADIKNVLNTGNNELSGLKAIQLRGLDKYRAGLTRKMAGLAQLGWNGQKKQAKSNSVKLSEAEEINPNDLPDKILKSFVINQADMVIDDQTTNLKAKAIYTAQSAIMRGQSVDQAMSSVNDACDEYIASGKISGAAESAIVMAYNYGMNKFNQSIGDQLWGYVFCAVDDDKTSEICLWYNGKTFSVDSPELVFATPPLHSNCRSWLEPLYKGVDAEPDIIDNAVAPNSLIKTANFL